jgi:hypothetical protein
MSSICFEPEGSSSGIRLYIDLYTVMVYCVLHETVQAVFRWNERAVTQLLLGYRERIAQNIIFGQNYIIGIN